MKHSIWVMAALAGLGLACSTGSSPAVESDAASSTASEPNRLSECERYIACARAAMPTGVTPIIAVYGSEGSCWDLPGVSEADCQAECRANRRAAFDAFPNQDICADCTRDADCGAGQYCKGNTCAASECDADGDCAEGLFCRTHRCVAPGVCAPPTCTMVGDEQICGMVGLHGSCLDSTRCGEGMVCGAYEGAKRCTTVCRQSCREGLCSDARDAEGRGLCLECKTDAHCSTGGPCRSDGRCGCFEDTDCPTRTCLRTRL